MVAIGKSLNARGWTPATSGNFSSRLAGGAIAITASGAHKGRMSEDDFVVVSPDGSYQDGEKRPSAETELHLQIYRLYPDVSAVLHTHSVNGVAFTRAFPTLKAWTIEAHELLKAFPGQTTHDSALDAPIIDNNQDMSVLTAAIEPYLVATPRPPAYLIRGHGLYAWGRDLAEAERVVEAIEWLFGAELAERQFRAGVRP